MKEVSAAIFAPPGRDRCEQARPANQTLVDRRIHLPSQRHHTDARGRALAILSEILVLTPPLRRSCAANSLITSDDEKNHQVR